jgi:beta-carotene ketolase (CrtO type)
MTYDVIVVGGGHNGLTCAAYLAKAGRSVLVVEANPYLGGMATTRETVAEAPGFLMNPCAVDTLLTNVPGGIIGELQLERHGLTQARPEPWGSYLHPDGASIGLWRSVDRTCAEIRRFSRRDAERFAEFVDVFTDFWWTVAPYLQDHPTRPRARTVGEVAWRAIRHRSSLKTAAKLLAGSPRQLIDEWFESDELKAMLAVYAAGSAAPLEEAGSAAFVGIMVLHFAWGITRPVGGMGAFTAALSSVVRAAGGEIRTASPVAEVLVSPDGDARGVRLVDGQELRARHVVGAVHPQILMDRLLDPQFVPQAVREELRAIRDLPHDVSQIKIDIALSERPKLACGRPELWGSYMLLGPDLEYTRRAISTSMTATVPDEIPMWLLMPSAVDRTQVPAGSSGDTLYLYAPAVPRTPLPGWATERDAFTKRALDIVDVYAPGTSDAVIGHYVKDPDELSTQGVRGSITHVDMSMDQMGPWRPCRSMAGYRTPIDGLWHTGAGAFPAGGVHGWSGRTTARTVDKALRKAR